MNHSVAFYQDFTDDHGKIALTHIGRFKIKCMIGDREFVFQVESGENGSVILRRQNSGEGSSRFCDGDRLDIPADEFDRFVENMLLFQIARKSSAVIDAV